MNKTLLRGLLVESDWAKSVYTSPLLQSKAKTTTKPGIDTLFTERQNVTSCQIDVFACVGLCVQEMHHGLYIVTPYTHVNFLLWDFY